MKLKDVIATIGIATIGIAIIVMLLLVCVMNLINWSITGKFLWGG